MGRKLAIFGDRETLARRIRKGTEILEAVKGSRDPAVLHKAFDRALQILRGEEPEIRTQTSIYYKELLEKIAGEEREAE